jgi:D-sedoheptulose 7-phosphate isomerase
MKIAKYLENYELIFQGYEVDILSLVEILKIIKSNQNKVMVLGNGASAAVSSHIANDLTKATKIKALTFHDPALITCFGNDFGYENWMKEALNHFYEKDDLVILISSSGNSKNIVNAARFCKRNKLKLVSLTGPNPSKEVISSSYINFRVNSDIYNIIECIHMIILTSAIDQINMIKLK